jgi:hypothetical protein
MTPASSSVPTAIQPKPVKSLNPYRAWLRGVPVKWRVLLAVAPFTLLFGLLEVLFHELGWELWKFDSLTGSLLGAASFILALVLSGTLGQYHACEEMVLELINEAEAINDRLVVHGVAAPTLDATRIRLALAATLEAVRHWLLNKSVWDEVQQSLSELNASLSELEAAGRSDANNPSLANMAKIRLLLSRISSNRDHDFIAPAYALLELFLLGVVVALLLIGADNFGENLVVSSFLFTSFLYLVFLIRDLDNPFEYDGSSSVDVDLAPLQQCEQRLRQIVAGGSGV